MSGYDLPQARVIVGVTSRDPESITDLPDYACELPESRIIDGGHLYTDGSWNGEKCPYLSLSEADTSAENMKEKLIPTKIIII